MLNQVGLYIVQMEILKNNLPPPQIFWTSQNFLTH